MGGLADAAENQLPARGAGGLDCLGGGDKRGVQPPRGFHQGLGLQPDAGTGTGQGGFWLQGHLGFESQGESAEFTVNLFPFNPIPCLR